MEFFTASGRFWLPRDPSHTAHGMLIFDQDGIRLELDGSLRPAVANESGIIHSSPQWITEPIVHGRLRHPYSEVTLLQVSGFSMPGLDAESWSAAFSLTGGLVGEDAFSQMTVELGQLMPWTGPQGILRSDLTDPDVTIDTELKTLDAVKLDDGTTVQLITRADGQWGDTAVHIDQWCAFQVTGKPKSLLEILDQWMRPLQDLLVVCLGQPIPIEAVRVRPPVHHPREPTLNVAFKAVQPPAKHSPPHIESFDAPTLLTYQTSSVPFALLIKNWFCLCDRLPDAVTQFCGPYYAPFIYTRHRYTSIFQSAEVLARALARAAGRTKEKSRGEHRRRVKIVAKALESAELDQEIIDWVKERIRRNDKPLAQLIEEMITSTGDVGRQLLAAVPNVASLAVSTRNRVSHPGAKGPELMIQYRLGQALTWVIRVRLLAELGIPVSALAERTIQRSSFQQDVQELAALYVPTPKASRLRRYCAAKGGTSPPIFKQLLRKLRGRR